MLVVVILRMVCCKGGRCSGDFVEVIVVVGVVEVDMVVGEVEDMVEGVCWCLVVGWS